MWTSRQRKSSLRKALWWRHHHVIAIGAFGVFSITQPGSEDEGGEGGEGGGKGGEWPGLRDGDILRSGETEVDNVPAAAEVGARLEEIGRAFCWFRFYMIV